MYELTLVIPTFKERSNIDALLERLQHSLDGVLWEVVFVDDDSPDGTADFIRMLSRKKPHIRCLHRVKRRGLSSAVIEGMMSSAAPYIAVMDADLQHDESILPLMLREVSQDGVDLAIGSRYVEGGSVGEWDYVRHGMSRLATRLSNLVVREKLSDPMSGFFMIKSSVFHGIVRNLSGEGYKILLDIVASSTERLTIRELPYVFRNRHSGESKIDALVLWEYLMLLLDKTVGKYIPPRFILFCLVGGVGVVIHFLILWVGYVGAAVSFTTAQTVATIVAMTSNFLLNNLLTYRDRRLRGNKFIIGLLSFYAVCAIGVIGNVGVASFVFAHHYTWWLAGGAGAIIGTVWNYAASSILTWRKK